MTSPYREIPVKSVKPSPFNYDGGREKKVDDLAASIAAKGVLQPILVRPVADDEWEVVAGHRRLAASRKAKLETIPAVVVRMTDREAIEAILVENSQREDVHPLDEADNYRRLTTPPHNLRAEDVAAKIGRSPAYVHGRMRLCSLHKKVARVFRDGGMSLTTALAIARVSEALQPEAADTVRHYHSHADVDKAIRDRFMLRIAQAQFDPKDATLVPAAGSCTDCPKRSGNVPALFPDLAKDDRCTDRACWSGKESAAWAKRAEVEKAKGDAGATVVADEDAKALFEGYDRTRLKGKSGLVDLGDEDMVGGKWQKWRAALGKDGRDLRRTLARDGAGHVHEMVDRKEALRVLKDAGKLDPHMQAGLAGGAADGERRRRQASQARKQAVTSAMGRIVEHARKLGATDDAPWRWLLRLLAGAGFHDAFVATAKRRGVNTDDPSEVLARQSAALKGGDLRALVIEVALWRDGVAYGSTWHSGALDADDALAMAARAARVDLKALTAEALKAIQDKRKPSKRAAKTARKGKA